MLFSLFYALAGRLLALIVVRGRGQALPPAAKLLVAWMEWERGDETPGQVMANLKKAGMRDLLEQLASDVEAAQD